MLSLQYFPMGIPCFWVAVRATLWKQLKRRVRNEMSKLFAKNTGNVDRIIRVILGALLVGNVFVGLQTVVGWLGLVLIITGLFGTCPVYSLLGINTRTLGEKVGLK